ncbi:unnamed protein product [Zymoseptoria tritici ST99CH_3D1]|nr:unnamed protein product [Zymoseptoria tritici ST99CH_3D1]
MTSPTSTSSDIPAVHPPASNPGHDNPTAGIPEYGGGLSSTAYIESPVQNGSTTATTEDGETGIVASLKNMLGLGGAAATSSTDNEQTSLPSNEPVRAEDKGPAEDATTATAVTATGAATAIATAVGTGTYLNYRDGEKDTAVSPAASNTTTLPDRSVGQSPATTNSASTLDDSASTLDNSASTLDNSASTLDNSASTLDNSASTLDNSASTLDISGPPASAASTLDNSASTPDISAPPASAASHTDPIAPTADSLPDHTSSTTNTTSTAQDPSSQEEDSTNTTGQKEHKPPIAASSGHPPPSSSDPAPHEAEHSEKHHAVGGRTGNVENVDSIPTAGGERLGDKHWGESKVVPDDPKAQGAGVQDKGASAEVKDNTAKNTGGATSGPHGHGSAGEGKEGEQKESLMDKVKDKLHSGKK